MFRTAYGEMPGQKEFCCGLYIRVYSCITSIENEWIFNTLIIILIISVSNNEYINT